MQRLDARGPVCDFPCVAGHIFNKSMTGVSRVGTFLRGSTAWEVVPDGLSPVKRGSHGPLTPEVDGRPAGSSPIPSRSQERFPVHPCQRGRRFAHEGGA